MATSTSRPRVSIVGAPGYGGGEALRLLFRHPLIELAALVSKTFAGQPVWRLFPGFPDRERLFQPFDRERIVQESDVVFIAQESGFAMKHAPFFLESGRKVIDFSADFRLRDISAYQTWYGREHTSPHLVEQAVFGLPELFRKELKYASLVANPGCYPTATALALTPLLERQLINPESIVIDAKSGVSGAGRAKTTPEYHFAEVNESVRAYSIAGAHRHTPEIEQILGRANGSPLIVSFTPHLIPVTRGILSTCYAVLKGEETAVSLRSVYAERYRNERFVTVYPEGELPATKGVYGSNQCHIGLGVDRRTRRVTVVSAIDNLIKGAAGQAVQSMNIMMGFPEETGLDFPGIWP